MVALSLVVVVAEGGVLGVAAVVAAVEGGRVELVERSVRADPPTVTGAQTVMGEPALLEGDQRRRVGKG